jgi:UDPglucose 6-dehydrogenase
MKISFIGLGKLGLPLSTNFAKNGNKVIAIDKNKSLINKLQNNVCPWYEEGLENNILKSSSNIEYTTNYDKVHETDVTIILVNTPSNKKDGSFSNLYVEQSIEEVSNQLKKHNKKNHLFILSSTVMPTSIKNSFIPLIENITNWKLNDDFGFCYVPDFVAIGKVINDFENPDFLLVGQSNEHYGKMTEELYKTIILNDCETSKLTLPEAEMCKVSLNAYITTKISFANYLGLLCEKIDPTINVDNVTNTIGKDKRIGNKYFKSGTSYGGTCFPRDTWAFMKLSNNVGMFAHQMNANEMINDLMDESIFLKIVKQKSKKIGLVGLGFKKGTAVVTEGLAYKLINKMKDSNYQIHVFDFISESFTNLQRETNTSLINCSSMEELVNNVDIIVICNEDENYSIPNISIGKKIINPWRIKS